MMGETGSVVEWLDQWIDQKFSIYIKRLSANDTLATGAHQAGPYIPKDLLFDVFPSLHLPEKKNPRIPVDIRIDSHGQSCKSSVIWYNNKIRGGTRNETRITNLGGRSSALLDPESTGALAVFVFDPGALSRRPTIHIWVARNLHEEEAIELRYGPVEPGEALVCSPLKKPRKAPHHCFLPTESIPADWLKRFPSGEEILQKTLELSPAAGLEVDKRLIRRRACEYELFRSVEEAIELPRISLGFKTVDEFLERAQEILQRRKARAGRSLELQLKTILKEEGFREGVDFEHDPELDEGDGTRTRPDFLFPSQHAYSASACPAESLRILAVKTTCRDRWRQVLNEAKRVRQKHLLTLQEGVSESQHREMVQAGVQLVVPTPLHRTYPATVRATLLSLEAFLDEIRRLRLR